MEKQLWLQTLARALFLSHHQPTSTVVWPQSPKCLLSFLTLKSLSIFYSIFRFIVVFSSPLGPHNELQKFHSTAKYLSKPPLTTTSSIPCVISKASAFDYTKSLRCFVEIRITPRTPSAVSRRPKNREVRTAADAHNGRRAGFTCSTTGFLILLLVFTAPLNKPLVLLEGESTPFSQLNSNLPSLCSFIKKLQPLCLLWLLEICFIALKIAALLTGKISN